MTNFKLLSLGRRRPIARGPRLSLRNYLKQTLPAPPPTTDYYSNSYKSLNQMYDNDILGDCVIACMAHIDGVLSANAGTGNIVFRKSQIINLYSAIGGYIPGNPDTDNGCDEQTALNYWQQNGLTKDAHKITAWLSVDGSNATEVCTALWLFENLIFGVELPDAWINPEPSMSGFMWDVAGPSDPNNGHCFAGVGYNTLGVNISTWGMTGNITFPAISQYAVSGQQGELYTVLSTDAINKAKKKAPNGFAFSQLLADLDAMGVAQ